MTTNISTLGQSLGLINRVKQIQSQMTTYQQQVTTGVKYQSFKEYGADAQRIQRYRADLTGIEGYLYNIETTQVNIKQMDMAMSENIKQAGNILTAISVQMAKGTDFDLAAIKSAAKTAIEIFEANMNVKVGDRYLFAGSDVSQKPYDNASAGDSNIQQRLNDWMDGTTDTATLLSGLQSMTDSQSGYSNGIQLAKNVYARADDSFEIDYTVLANSDGFKNVINGLRTLANIDFPTEGVDVPTKDQFYDVLNGVYANVQAGVDDLRASSSKISAAAQALENVRQNHLDDRQNLQRVLESTESADTTEAVVKFQTLQTQLQASYQVTSALTTMSLAKYLSFQ